MARITSHKAAQVYGGIFDLVLGASQRARELARGDTANVKSKNGPVVTALREIEEGKYTKADYMKTVKVKSKREFK